MLIKFKPPYSTEKEFSPKYKWWQQDTQIVFLLNIIKIDNLIFNLVNQVFV